MRGVFDAIKPADLPVRLLLYNIRGGNIGKENDKFSSNAVDRFLRGSGNSTIHIIGLTELKSSSSFVFDGYIVHHSPGLDDEGCCTEAGGATLLLHRSISEFLIKLIPVEESPPEVAAAIFNGGLFGYTFSHLEALDG